MTDTFAIIRKDTKEFFVGFASDGSVEWASDNAKAWRRDYLTATAQSSLFIRLDIPAQRKVVAA